MIAFVCIAAAMVVLAIGWILWPLLRGAARRVEHAAANLAVFRDQFADLDADLQKGMISPDQYAESKSELERRLLDEAGGADASPAVAAPRSPRWPAVVVALMTPIGAAALYWQVGTPEAFSPQVSQATPDEPVSPEALEAMVAKVMQRLEKEPDNAEGWAMLARVHYVSGKFPEAVAAYEKLAALQPDNADVLADYADALAMNQGKNFEGMPMQLVRQALRINPAQWKALAMAGSEAFGREDYPAAVDYWQRLLAVAPPDSPAAQKIQGSIDEARLAGSLSGTVRGIPPKTAGGSVTGTVALSPSLAEKVRPDDSVFVFARPADGSRMPVAVVRSKASELPLTFSLDDSRSMAPTSKISSLAEVVVSARISRSGNAMASTGDLEAAAEKVKVGRQGITLTIDRTVP